MGESVVGERNGVKEDHVASDVELAFELNAGVFELVF